MKKNILLALFSILFCTSSFSQIKMIDKTIHIGTPKIKPGIVSGLCIATDSIRFEFGNRYGFSLSETIEESLPEILDPTIKLIYSRYDTICALKTFTKRYLNLGNAQKELNKIYAYRYYSTGSTSIYTTSDSAVKTNIRNIDSSLCKVMLMRPVSFNTKSLDNVENEPNVESQKTKIGFIAQEMQRIIPEVVLQMEDTNLLAMDYAALIPVLVKAIQEQQALILQLQGQIAEIKTSSTQNK